MKKIFLFRSNRFALVDDEDFEFLNRFSWNYQINTQRVSYAVGVVAGYRMPMHRLIANPPANLDVDHKNGDGLDNRKENLRHATAAQNAANKRRRKGNNRYIGVGTVLTANGPRYTARTHSKGRAQLVGVFTDEKEAARARDKAAKIVYGEFAVLNFPPKKRSKKK